MLDTYMSLMKTYPERGSEFNDIGSMVHISFGTLSQSDYTNGDPSLEFWCYAGMNVLPSVQSSLKANNLMFLVGVSTLPTPM